jgi:hypothetical protein
MTYSPSPIRERMEPAERGGENYLWKMGTEREELSRKNH